VQKQLVIKKNKSSIFFTVLGLGILAALLYLLDLGIILQSFQTIGMKIFLVFAIAISWMICNTLCLSTFLNHQIPFPHLLYNQITGDAYNIITPFAGLGGEPYKINHLSQWVSLSEASEAIIRDRLTHSLSGLLYTAMTLITVLFFVPLETAMWASFTSVAAIISVLSIVLMALILSKKPNQLLHRLLKKLKILESFRSTALLKSTFFKALGFKLIGRVLNLVEIYVVFVLLGIAPSVVDVVTVSAMVALSGTLLFIIPQGIGVNEAGISGAFNLLGYAAVLGLSLGLIRRARVIFWALFGVALHLCAIGIQKYREGEEGVD